MLVLDNFESPWEDSGSRRAVEHTLEKLSAIGTLTLIITMRGQQRPRGTLWTKPFLPILMPFDLDAARKAFVAIAPDHEDDPVLDELLKEVDCMPLAVNLLAYVAESEPSLTGVLQRWHSEKTHFIKDDSGDDHLGSLEASIQLSLDSSRMTAEPNAEDLLSVLALLPNGLSIMDLEGPALGLKPSAHSAAAALRKTALVFDDEQNGRLRVLSPIRIYVTTRHPPSPKVLQALQKRYADLAKKGKQIGSITGVAALPRLLSEAENMQAIIEHALTPDEDISELAWSSIEWAIEAATNLADFLWYSGRCSTRSLEIAAMVSQELQKPTSEAACLSGIGFVASGRSQTILAQESYQSALALYRAHKDIAGLYVWHAVYDNS